MSEVLIKCENVSKKFCRNFKQSLIYGLKDVLGAGFGKNNHHGHLRKNEFWAVKDINFELKRGECLGLIGHNGAGKSTLLKMLNGLITPDQGKITMRGRIGALIELGAGFNPILTGRENIYNNGAVLGFTKEEIDHKIDAIIEFSEIGEFIDSPVQNYSSGMKVRLGFAVAAQMEPDVLIIDEVLAVGDVGFRFKCLNAIGELMKSSAVIFVSHSMPQIYRICNEVMLMNHGSLLLKTNQIGVGIEKYYNMFSSGDQNIAGSGGVKLKNCQLQAKNHIAKLGETLSIKHGDDLQIKFDFELENNIPEVSLQVVIWNQEMLPVADILNNELKGYIVKQNQTGLHSVELSVPQIQFNAGKHSISLMFNSVDFSKSYCRYDNAGYINLDSNFASGAHFLIPVNWKNN